MFYVYRHTFPDGRVYIGRTKNDISKRAGSHGIRYGKSNLVSKAIHDFGWETVTKEILHTVETLEEADNLERIEIRNHRSTDIRFGYNMTIGGSGGFTTSNHRKPLSIEVRRRIGECTRQSLTGRRLSPQTIEKIRQSLLGHEVTPETREKIRLANTGRHPSDETRKKMSVNNGMHNSEVVGRVRLSLKKTQKERTAKRIQTMKERYPDGLHWSEDHKKKLSQALKGKPKSEETKMKMRKPKSEETKAKMREAQRISHAARRLGMTYEEYLKTHLIS